MTITTGNLYSCTFSFSANSSKVDTVHDTIKIQNASTYLSVNDLIRFVVTTNNVMVNLRSNTAYYVSFSNASDIALSTEENGSNVSLEYTETTNDLYYIYKLSKVKQLSITESNILSVPVFDSANNLNVSYNSTVLNLYGNLAVYANSTFGENVSFNKKIIDSDGSGGLNNQVLTSNGSAVFWTDIISSGSINVNTNASYTWSNNHTFNANITAKGIIANGSIGTAGQVLTSNGSSTYWTTPTTFSVNTAAQYTWTNTHTFNANVVVNKIIANGSFGTSGQVLKSDGTKVFWGADNATDTNIVESIITNYLDSLPTTLPATSGQYWWNGGVLSKS